MTCPGCGCNGDDRPCLRLHDGAVQTCSPSFGRCTACEDPDGGWTSPAAPGYDDVVDLLEPVDLRIFDLTKPIRREAQTWAS